MATAYKRRELITFRRPMIITCPACSTHYSVIPAALGVTGKSVRCFRCSNKWHQVPVAEQPQVMAPQPVPPPPAAVPPPAPVAAPPPAAAAAPAPAPEPEPTPEPTPEPAPEPAPEPEPEPEAAPEKEPETAGEEAAEEEERPPSPSEEESEPLTQEEMDAMFGDTPEEPEAVESLVDVEGEEDEDSAAIDPEDLPDPEPIPDALIAPIVEEGEEPEPRGRMASILTLAAVVLVVFGGLGAGLYFARGAIVSFLPAAAGVYGMIGLSGEELGEGLAIRGVKSVREKEQGVEVLVIRGIIINGTEEPKSVPLVRVSLYDAEDNEIQYVVVAPSQKDVDPGKRSDFEARLKQPSPLARRVEVTFTKDMGEG